MLVRQLALVCLVRRTALHDSCYESCVLQQPQLRLERAPLILSEAEVVILRMPRAVPVPEQLH